MIVGPITTNTGSDMPMQTHQNTSPILNSSRRPTDAGRERKDTTRHLARPAAVSGVRRPPTIYSLIVLMLLSVMGPDLFAQAIRGEEATEADGAVFHNDRARQHMLELEQRMFRLAEMLKASQPEDAQRLIMGVERSRDQLLVERMAEVSKLINGVELTEASKQVDGVITELKTIKKLMLTADLALALKREQLRKINNAIKEIEKIEAQEARNKAQSDKLAESDGKNGPAMKGLSEAEKRNQDATDRLADKVGDINPKDPSLGAAKGALGKAGGKMGQASDKLGKSGNPSGASKDQKDAQDKLKDAKAKLNEAKKKLQEELERKIREMVVDNLRAMLKQQKEIREQLELVSEDADQGKARALVQVKGLAPPEQEIVVLAADTVDLCEQTEFSIAMPAAMTAVRERMVYLVDDYSAGKGGPKVVKRTIRVEEDLAALIAAMELSNQNQKPPSPPKDAPPMDKTKREANQMLAELRMLRIMQVATNENVIRLEETRVEGDMPATQLRKRELSVRDQQDMVREATDKLRLKAMQGG